MIDFNQKDMNESDSWNLLNNSIMKLVRCDRKKTKNNRMPGGMNVSQAFIDISRDRKELNPQSLLGF